MNASTLVPPEWSLLTGSWRRNSVSQREWGPKIFSSHTCICIFPRRRVVIIMVKNDTLRRQTLIKRWEIVHIIFEWRQANTGRVNCLLTNLWLEFFVVCENSFGKIYKSLFSFKPSSWKDSWVVKVNYELILFDFIFITFKDQYFVKQNNVSTIVYFNDYNKNKTRWGIIKTRLSPRPTRIHSCYTTSLLQTWVSKVLH